MGNSKVLYVKISNNGKTLEAKKPFCSVVILAIVKFSLYRIRDKIHRHGNDILKHTCEAEQYVSLCRPSYLSTHAGFGVSREWKGQGFVIWQVWTWLLALPESSRILLDPGPQWPELALPMPHLFISKMVVIQVYLISLFKNVKSTRHLIQGPVRL